MNNKEKKPIGNTPTMNLRNRIGFFLLFIAALSFFTWAQTSPGQRFQEANQLYEKGDYDGAVQIYHEIESHTSHWRLFYNVGNCYFKLENWVRAKIYYLKARRLEPFNESIAKNISIVNKRLNDKVPASRADFVSRVMLKIESIVSLNVLSLFLILLVLVFNVFLFLLIKRGKQKWYVYGVSFSLVLVILLASYHMYRVGKFNTRNVAVITYPEAQLRSGPGDNNTVLFKVNPGLEVKIIDRNSTGQWFQVSASSDIAGWIEADKLETI
jgi:tetratricopeptide (TPR) repeat protein